MLDQVPESIQNYILKKSQLFNNLNYTQQEAVERIQHELEQNFDSINKLFGFYNIQQAWIYTAIAVSDIYNGETTSDSVYVCD